MLPSSPHPYASPNSLTPHWRRVSSPRAAPVGTSVPQRRLFALTEPDGVRTLDAYRWGLLPSWAKDPTIANRLFNARGETVAEKPSFRSAFAKRPCVIPVDGFYEWDHRPGRNKQPNYFTRSDGQLMLFAGLYEQWRDPTAQDTTPLKTCTIITTTPSKDMDEIHDRMPVVLRAATSRPGSTSTTTEPTSERNCVPRPRGNSFALRRGQAVGSVRNDGP